MLSNVRYVYTIAKTNAIKKNRNKKESHQEEDNKQKSVATQEA